MPDDYRITRQSEETTFDRDGKVLRRVRVEFMSGDDGPFSLLFDRDTFSAVTAKPAIDAFVRELRAMRGA